MAHTGLLRVAANLWRAKLGQSIGFGSSRRRFHRTGHVVHAVHEHAYWQRLSPGVVMIESRLRHGRTVDVPAHTTARRRRPRSKGLHSPRGARCGTPSEPRALL